MGMMNAFRAAKTGTDMRHHAHEHAESVPIYVPHEISLKDGPVTITTMKLKIQFDANIHQYRGNSLQRHQRTRAKRVGGCTDS